MKTKFNLEGQLPLNKMIEIHNATIVVRTIFHENKKIYLQVFLDEYLYAYFKH